jgi:cell division protein DivIC
VNLRQVILSLYILLLAGLGVAGLVLFKDAHDEYSQLEQVQSANRQKLAEARDRLRAQERILERLKSDPAYVDRVIRMKLGYSKPDEYIFRFESDNSRLPVEPAPARGKAR